MKKNLKVFVSLLALTLVLGIQTTARAAEETTPAFAITEEAVIIDHVPYAIENGAIQYEGKTYEVQEDGVLATYDENGQETLAILPLEQYKVTDPRELAEMDKIFAAAQKRDTFTRIFGRRISDTLKKLPLYGSVATGNSNYVTPVFDLYLGQAKYGVYLRMWEFSNCSKEDKRFTIPSLNKGRHGFAGRKYAHTSAKPLEMR